MLAAIHTLALNGVEARPVVVEVDLHSGLPAFNVVGLPDTAVREARERVKAAVKNSGFDFPLKRITVNLAPADLQKVGPGFDLAIACGILVASYQLKAESLAGSVLCGELALDGHLRSVRGALSLAVGAEGVGASALVLPVANMAEAALVEGLEIVGLNHLTELPKYCAGTLEQPVPIELSCKATAELPDLADIRGHLQAKKALEIAAAGGHNLLMYGPPGSGKTVLARCLASILPPLTKREQIETTQIYSVASRLGHALVAQRPFRAPHHSASMPALIGGGSPPRPGEVSLAHNGVLFLDELAEFQRAPLEALRQPLEDGHVTVARASEVTKFPARFMLVAATNPCGCGFVGDSKSFCRCSPAALARYRARLSGPLLDRIDILMLMARPQLGELAQTNNAESSESVRARVVEARERQARRFDRQPIDANGQMGLKSASLSARLSSSAEKLLKLAEGRSALGGRGYVRVLRVSRTVADLAGKDRIDRDAVALALAYHDLKQFSEAA